MSLCRCGHARDAHAHYRAGTDCGACGPARCPRFRRRWLDRLRGAAWTPLFLSGLAGDVGRRPRAA